MSSSVANQPVTKLMLVYHMLTGALVDQSYNFDDDDDREVQLLATIASISRQHHETRKS